MSSTPTPPSNHSTSTDYEKLVESLLQQELGGLHGIKIIELARNVPMKGLSGYTHQIDVMYRLHLWLTELLVLVECKKYARRVGIDDLLEFKSRLDDLRAHKGVFVTSSNYQSGAIEFAKANRIALLVVDGTKTLPIMYSLASLTEEEKCQHQLKEIHKAYKDWSSHVSNRTSIDWKHKTVVIQHDGAEIHLKPWELRQSMLYKQACELTDPEREGLSFTLDNFGQVKVQKVLKSLLVDELLIVTDNA